MSVNRNKGFTLIESMMVILIVAIIAGLAVPGMQLTQANGRVRTTAADLNAALSEARSQAVARRSNVTLTPVGGDWRNGWLMNATLPDNEVVNLVAHRGVPISVAVDDEPAVNGLVFLPTGLVETDAGAAINTVRFRVCDDNINIEVGRNVWLTRVGRTGLRRHEEADGRPTPSVCNPGAGG